MAACWHRIAPFAAFLAAAAFPAPAAIPGADYVMDKAASPVARAYFAAVPEKLAGRKVAKAGARPAGDGEAFFTEDGSISIPPHGMVAFEIAGRCMDPHLPAPAAGEPMQFVDRSALVPPRLRKMYDNLVLRMSRGDPRVAAANPQHLVWAIRTAGTDDPFADNLSGSQLEILDECAGRRGAFLKYHEKEKKRNARKGRKRGKQNRISVGGVSYDASELCGTNAVRRMEEHIAALSEMGRTSTTRTEEDFRYGEIEEDLYSDITGSGGLAFTARIINASDRRKEFRAADFVAQVGNGSAEGAKRQRITMGDPGEFVSFSGAVAEGVDVDRGASTTEMQWREDWTLRGRARSKTTRRTGEKRTRTTTMVSGTQPVAPVIAGRAPEAVEVRVVSLEYDAASGKGVLTVEVVSGSFKEAAGFVRGNLASLVRDKSPETAADIPASANLAAETVSITESGLCEVGFKVLTE